MIPLVVGHVVLAAVVAIRQAIAFLVPAIVLAVVVTTLVLGVVAVITIAVVLWRSEDHSATGEQRGGNNERE